MQNSYEQQLLEAWEASYKQGQLTLWIFLALRESPKTIAELKTYLSQESHDTIVADDKSLYRSLRRYYDTEMVDTTTQPSVNSGPPVKVYELTKLGSRLLEVFVQRNMAILIHNKQIKEMIR